MNWSLITTAETAHCSEYECFSSEEPGSGAKPPGVESLQSPMEMEGMEERNRRFTPIAGWKHLPEKIAHLSG